MSKESLERQADRAENIADQTVDGALKETLRDAAHAYREEAEAQTMYALFKGDTQLTGTFRTREEAFRAIVAGGLIPEMQTTDEAGADVLPADYHIDRVEQTYDPQPDWKLPREIS